MAHEFFTTPQFEKQLNKYDKRLKRIVIKKMEKIIEKPLLGKPLHKPLQNYRSERVEKLRIIYTIKEGKVCFVYLQHRKKVYR